MISFGMPTLIELNSLEESAALCRELGLKFIELNMSFPQNQLEKLDVDELLRIKEKYGIFYTVHLDEELNPCSLNTGVRQAYVENVLGTVELARKLGIPTLNMHILRGIYCTLPTKRVYIYEENEPVYLEYLRQFRDRVTEAIGDSGVKICVENTDGFDLPFLSAAVDLLLESPAFGLTLDVGHDHAIKNKDLPFVLARKERLHHMHLHDGLGANVHLALGDGEIDKDSFLALAKERRCRVVLETKTVAALRRSVAWTNRWLNRQCSPDEIWDVYDSDGRKTGRTHRRGDQLGEGELHLVLHCWIKNSRGEFLLTRRDPEKSYGGMWESVGGSALTGEDSLTAARREVKEETGLTLDPAKGRRVLRCVRDHYICDVWLFEQDFDLNDVSLQPGETCGVMYASAEKIRALAADDSFVPNEYLEEILKY